MKIVLLLAAACTVGISSFAATNIESGVTIAITAAPEADRCTFDFKGVSKRLYEKGDGTGNLVTNPNFLEKEDPAKLTSWRILEVQPPRWEMTAEEAAVAHKKVRELIKMSVDGGMASIRVPTEACDLVGGRKRAAWLQAYIAKLVMLGNATGGPYRITLRYRSNHEYGKDNNCAYVQTQPVHVDDASGKGLKKIGPELHQDFRDTGADTDSVTFWSQDITIPPGANAVDLRVRFMGAGYLKFTDFQLTERKEVENARPAVQFLLLPYGQVDNTFAIEQGEVGSLEMAWNAAKGVDLPWWKSWIELTVPKGFAFVGSNAADPSGRRRMSRTSLPDGSEQIRLPVGYRVQPYAGERFHDGNAIALLLRATGPVGSEGVVTFRAVGGDGAYVGEVGTCRLATVPPVRVVQPKRYRIGAMLTYWLQLYRTGEGANEAYADYLRAKGVTWLMPNTDWLVENPALLPMWRAKGFDLVTPTDHDYLINAYGIRGSCRRPPEEDFVPAPGRPDDWSFREHRSACPASIYEERPFFVTNIVPNLAKRSAGTDGQWVNWEPYFYKGCHCAYCTKKGAEWMEKTGDKNIEHFYSWQHGQTVKTINRWMKKSFAETPGGSAKVGLMPAVSFTEMTSECRRKGYPADKLSSDYVDEIAWMPLWGPYVAWSPWTRPPYGGPYGIQRGKSLWVFFAARDIREETDRFYKVKVKGEGGGVGVGKPKLIGQPAGTNWIIQPEWMEVSCDSYFFNRWEAVSPWMFPHGGDARHWTAYAHSVNRAAKYEDVVWDGTRNDAATTLAAKPGFDFRCAVLDADNYPNAVNVPFIQQTTYDYKGARYIACFNFDDESHSEFTLKTKGLPAGDYEVVAEDGQPLFGGKTFSADELATKGVELTLPVSACRVFTLKPAARISQ